MKLDSVGRSEMQAVETLRSEAMRRFLRYARELHEQTFNHLLMSVEEETQNHELKDELENSLKMNQMNIMTTEHELTREQENRKKHVSTRDEQIAKLQKEISEITETTAADKKNIENSTKTEEVNLANQFNEQEKMMLKKLEGLNKQYEDLCAANLEAEKELRRLKKVREEKVGVTLGEYDEFMDTMETDINNLTKQYTNESASLVTYQKDYADVMAWREERNRREEAERAEEERKRREEKLRYDSATLIQQWYRSKLAAKGGKKKKKKKK